MVFSLYLCFKELHYLINRKDVSIIQIFKKNFGEDFILL